MTAEHILNIDPTKASFENLIQELNKKGTDDQGENTKLAAQRAKNAEALAQALAKLEMEYLDDQKEMNETLVSKLLTSSHAKEGSHSIKEEMGKYVRSFMDKIPLSKDQKKTFEAFLKNPNLALKNSGGLDLSKFENLSPKEIKDAIKLANHVAKTVNPEELLTAVQTLVQANSTNGKNYLLEMAEASQVLGETIQQIALNDVDMQKFDTETIQAQINNLKTMLNNIQQDTNDQIDQIKKAERASFWKKFALCFVAAVMVVVGAAMELLGGSGTGLIVAGVVLMTTTLASNEIQKLMQDVAGLFTSDPKKREEIAAALSCAITVIVAIATTVLTMGTDLPEAGLQIAAAIAKAAGQGLAMGATAFSATGGSGDIAYAIADAKFGDDVRNDGTADQQKDAEKVEQTIGYITLAVGIAGGLMAFGASFAEGMQKVAKSATNAVDDTQNVGRLTKLVNAIKQSRIVQGLKNTLEDVRDSKGGKSVKGFLDAHGYKLVGGFQIMGTGGATVAQIQQAEANIAAAFARLFANTDETTYKQGVKSIEMAQQGWQENQTAIEAQTVNQVQQEGVRTNIEQDAMIQQAKIIASIKA